MPLVLLGLNHETTPLSVRERVAYSPEDALDALRRVKSELDVSQAMLLSTCNRTELYALVPDPDRHVPLLTRRVFEERLGNDRKDDLLYRRDGAEAIRHLFRVSCGLDSLVLGEQEILAQVKGAYEIARTAETAGTLFHKLASRAFRVGKRARTETRIGVGAISVAFAAVELAEKVFSSLEGRGALLVGAGENGALCARHLLARNVDPFLIANRTRERAEGLAQQLGGEVVDFERLEQALARVDIVVSTTGAPEPVLTEEMVKSAVKTRTDRNLVMIDIAVPRDVDPGVDGIHNVFRFDMEALEEIVEQNRARREGEVPRVERLIQAEVDAFLRWWESLASRPVIADLHARFGEIRAGEVKRNAKRFSAEDKEQLEVFSTTLVRKLLMGLTTEIKGYRNDDPVQMERLAVLRQVFRLDEAEEEEEDID